MPHYHKLCGQKCYLSPVRPSDAEYFSNWLNDLEVAIPLGDEAYDILTYEKISENLLHAIQNKEPVFSIIENATDQVIGRCLLFGVNPVDRCANLGIFIGDKDWWNQGIGTEAICLLLDYAFNLLNLHSVMLGAFSYNERALHTYERIGFKKIGVRRETRWIGGKAYDAVLMDILEDEFREKWKSVIRIS